MKHVPAPGRITVTIATDGKKAPVVLSLRRPWIVVVTLAILAVVAAGIFAIGTYVTTMRRLQDYTALSQRIDELRGQNERLSDLETELHELLVFQNRILNLTGVQSVLRLGGSEGDNRVGLFGPDSTGGTGLLVIWPVTGKRIRQHGGAHVGVDIAAIPGQTVMAAGAGEVVGVDAEGSSGFRLRIAHGDSLVTVYSNVSDCLVKQGEHVEAGQVVARVGAGFEKGEGDEGHLHFEVYQGGKAVPPEDFVRRLSPN